MSFEEVQRFRQKWIVGLLLGTALLVLYALRASQGVVAFSAQLLVLGVIALVFASRLETRVEDDAVSVRFFPFHLSPRRFEFDAIESFHAEDYSPIGEFGGWGVRWRPFAGKIAYNVSGSEGVRLELENGKEVMIGSQKPEELEEAIGEEIE
jgi:hypothetical protein